MMTNQQKYIELKEKHTELGQEIFDIETCRCDIRDQMELIANSFPDSFYYRVGDKLLFRIHEVIELRKFDK